MADRPGFRASTRALRLRNFRLFWFGALVSNTGTWMQILVLAYVIDEITDRGAWVGLVTITQMMLTVFTNLWAGPLADRVPRRSIILVTQSLLCVGAFGFAALWGAGVRSPVIYMLLAWGYGILNGFMLPAWQAFISELVPKELLLNAVTLNSTQFQATRAVGPALGGVLLGFFGPGWVFFANGVSFFAVLFTVLLIQVPRLLPDDPPPIRVFADLREVLSYWRTQPGIKRAFKTVLITATCAQPLIFLIVVFAEEEFNTTGWQLGLLAAGTGIGSVIFFPLVAGRGQFTARSRLLAIGLSAYGLALAGFGLAPWYAMTILFLLILGGCHLATASTLNTVIQLQVEESMRGRIIALYLMAINLAIGAGTMIQGALFDWIGPRITVSISAGIIVVLAAWLVSTRRFASMDVGTAVT